MLFKKNVCLRVLDKNGILNFTFKISKHCQALASDLKVSLTFVMNAFSTSFTMKKDYVDLLTA